MHSHKGWTREETLLLIEKVKEFDKDWDLIAQSFNMKSPESCSSWYKFLCSIPRMLQSKSLTKGGQQQIINNNNNNNNNITISSNNNPPTLSEKSDTQQPQQEELQKNQELQQQLSNTSLPISEAVYALQNLGKDRQNRGRKRRNASEITREFLCPFVGCSRAYGSESALKLHFKTKHPEVVYTGPVDDYSGKNVALLANTTLTHHPLQLHVPHVEEDQIAARSMNYQPNPLDPYPNSTLKTSRSTLYMPDAVPSGELTDDSQDAYYAQYLSNYSNLVNRPFPAFGDYLQQQIQQQYHQELQQDQPVEDEERQQNLPSLNEHQTG